VSTEPKRPLQAERSPQTTGAKGQLNTGRFCRILVNLFINEHYDDFSVSSGFDSTPQSGLQFKSGPPKMLDSPRVVAGNERSDEFRFSTSRDRWPDLN